MIRVDTWTALCRLGLSCYLVLYLVAAGPLTTMAWRHGAHVTPEQWAYHLLMTRLGIPHHHGVDDEESAPEHTSHSAPHVSITLLLPNMLPILSMSPAPSPYLSDSFLPLWLGQPSDLLEHSTGWLRVAATQMLLAGRLIEPPERPPTV